MTALIINSIAVPVSASGWTETPEEIGERSRAFSGKSLRSIRAVKRSWAGKIALADPVQIEALRRLIIGDGFSWSFDADLFSDGKGLGPINANGATIVTSAPTPKFGAGCLSIPASTSVYFQGPAVGYPWTLAGWWWNSASWDHYVAMFDGTTLTKWLNGVITGTAAPFTVNGSGQMVLTSGAGIAHFFDDVQYFPFLVPAAWPAQMFGRGAAWPPIPFLVCWGDLFSPTGASFTVRGDATKDDATNRGTNPRLESLDFTLIED